MFFLHYLLKCEIQRDKLYFCDTIYIQKVTYSQCKFNWFHFTSISGSVLVFYRPLLICQISLIQNHRNGGQDLGYFGTYIIHVGMKKGASQDLFWRAYVTELLPEERLFQYWNMNFWPLKSWKACQLEAKGKCSFTNGRSKLLLIFEEGNLAKYILWSICNCTPSWGAPISIL